MDSASLFFNSPCNGNMFLFGNTDPIFQVPRSLLNIEENSKRRHFFCSPDDLIDEEYYDERMPEKKRRLTSDQVLLLEKSFEAEIKLEPERKTQLARELGLQPRQVAVWFQNRRARWKTKQLEIECENLKSDFLSLSSAHESILKQNEKLKSVVVSLTEKLQAKEVAGMAVVSQKSDPLLPALEPDNLGVQMSVKVEDRLSCGSGGSAVVDGDGLQLVDSGDSYFPDDDYQGCMGPVDGVQSEGDDGGGDGQAYFSTEFAAAEQQNLEAGEALGLWGWS